MSIPPKYEDVVAELEVLREGIIALNPESILKQEADYLDQISTLQQRLTVAEQRADDMVYALARIQGRAEMFIDDGMHMPTTSIEAIRDIAAKAALKPAAEVEALGARPVGCCCPPKGHTGIWAAAMCPVHFGLKRPGVSHVQ